MLRTRTKMHLLYLAGQFESHDKVTEEARYVDLM